MTEPAAEKRVGWAELFFDLVFVVAVTRVSGLVEHDHHAEGLLRSLVVFVPVYWLWVGTAILTNLNDMSRASLRLRVFAVALAGVFMALSMPDVYADGPDGKGLVFALAYWLGRGVLAVGVLRGGRPAARRLLTPYGVSLVLTGPLLVVGALLPPEPRLVVWGLAAVIDLATPWALQRWLRSLHYDAGHLAERFGLFVLIALGESVVAVASASAAEVTVVRALAVAAAFAVAVGLWWVYFHFAADAVRHALATAEVQQTITRTVLSYGHLAFIAAVIMVAVGLHDAVAHPAEHLSWPVVGLLYGGAALYLATFGMTRWAMFRLVSVTRLTAAAAVLVALPLSRLLPAVLALLLLAVLLAALNVVEYRRVGHLGWRSRLSARGRSRPSG